MREVVAVRPRYLPLLTSAPAKQHNLTTNSQQPSNRLRNFFSAFFVKRLEIINKYRLILHKVLTKATEWIFSNVELNS